MFVKSWPVVLLITAFTHAGAQNVVAGVVGAETADLVLCGGKIVTMDAANPQVAALAVRGDRILAVGDDAAIDGLVGPETKVIRLRGRLAVPGFIEGHGHFVGLGQSLMTLNLKTARSFSDIVRMVGEAAAGAPPGRWIIGRGWHQNKWDKPPQRNLDGYPTHEKLSAVSPHNPVLLTHASGHMCFANAKAMELAGVDRSTTDPAGGEILREENGDPIGVFRETAATLIHRAHDRSVASRSVAQRSAELNEAIRLAMEQSLAKGITTFQDAGSSFAVIDRLKAWAADGQLKLRLWVMIRENNAALVRNLATYRIVGFADHHLTVRAIKRAIDGALGTHGAWLLQPYDDLPGSTGLNTTSLESLRQTAELAIKSDYQLCVHAIGDRANRETLDLFEQVFRSHPEKKKLRWRIEHAQHLDLEDIPRFASLGVIASMQGNHSTSDAPYVVARLGLRRAQRGAYVWQSLLRTGAVVTNGTDAPVEEVDPIGSFYAAVTRKLPDGTAFFAEQRMTRQQALRSYTIDCAYAGFEEELTGSLAPDKLADVVILSRDIMSVPEEEILDAQVDYTVVGGQVVYERR